MDITNTDVQELEGIGPAYAQTLSEAGVASVFDLLENAPAALAFNTGLPLSKVEQWRSAALFLQAEGMNAQWAEATVAAGIYTFDDWLDKELAELAEVFENALSEGIIPTAPDTSQLYAITKEISRLHFGYKASGTVSDEQGNPIEGAEVLVGKYSTSTNAKGQWHLTGMQGAIQSGLIIIKEGFSTHYTANLTLENDNLIISSLTTMLTAGESLPITWDELDGDTLPSLTNIRSSIRIQGEDALRNKDLLVVSDHYQDGDIRMVSEYIVIENNVLVINGYRVSPDKFESLPTVGSYWIHHEGKFYAINMDRFSVEAFKNGSKNPPNAIRDQFRETMTQNSI